MKKSLVYILLFVCIGQTSLAQNEGRVGVFTGLYNSSLLNANDYDWGDYLPTFNSMIGIEGAYYVTIGKNIPVGFTGQVGYWSNGQNYRGLYLDSSYYEAYAKLNYIRAGIGLNVSTNLRRRVVARLMGGANVGFLDGYTDRYEHFRLNGDRFIVNIDDNAVYYKNELVGQYGTLNEKLYNPIDISVFYGLSIDTKLNDNFILSVSGRFDLGMAQIESDAKKKITFPQTNGDAEVIDYPGYPAAIKYHGPTRPEIIRQETVTQTYGVFLGLSYRFYNKDQHDIYYRN